MQTIHVSRKTTADGVLSLQIPLGRPDAEFEVLVVITPKDGSSVNRGWPPGYFDLAGSIDDETFVRPPQGELPAPVEFD